MPAKAVGLVLPELNGKLDGVAIRVPPPNVSVVDLTFEADRETSVEEINDAIRAAATGPAEGPSSASPTRNWCRWTSTMTPVRPIFHTDQTKVMEGTMCRILTWYDNEWGFSNRMNDTAVAMAKIQSDGRARDDPVAPGPQGRGGIPSGARPQDTRSASRSAPAAARQTASEASSRVSAVQATRSKEDLHRPPASDVPSAHSPAHRWARLEPATAPGAPCRRVRGSTPSYLEGSNRSGSRQVPPGCAFVPGHVRAAPPGSARHLDPAKGDRTPGCAPPGK